MAKTKLTLDELAESLAVYLVHSIDGHVIQGTGEGFPRLNSPKFYEQLLDFDQQLMGAVDFYGSLGDEREGHNRFVEAIGQAMSHLDGHTPFGAEARTPKQTERVLKILAQFQKTMPT